MPGDLDVHLNQEGPHSIAVEPDRFEAGGSFDVVLRNHGAALHVHLRLDDTLSRQATLGTTNHYVDEGSVRRVRVTVDEPIEPAEGRLKLVTGYGAETAYATIELADAPSEDRQVQVDAALGEPPARNDPSPLAAGRSLPVLALGAVAVLVAVAAAVAVRGPAAAVGLLVVLVGLGVAAALLRG